MNFILSTLLLQALIYTHFALVIVAIVFILKGKFTDLKKLLLLILALLIPIIGSLISVIYILSKKRQTTT